MYNFLQSRFLKVQDELETETLDSFILYLYINPRPSIKTKSSQIMKYFFTWKNLKRRVYTLYLDISQKLKKEKNIERIKNQQKINNKEKLKTRFS